MTTSTLYGQTAQTGLTADTSLTNGTIGLHFTVSAARTLDGVWYYSPGGITLTDLPTTIALYSMSTASPASATSTLVTSNTASWSGAAQSGWVFAAFASPPALSAGTNYMAVTQRSDTSGTHRWFSFKTGVTWPVSSADSVITAPKDTGDGQGWFNGGDSSAHALAFPASQNAGFSWYLDVQASAGGTARTASASLTVTPSLSSAPQAAHVPSASLTVAPHLSAAAARSAFRSALLTVTPEFGVAALRAFPAQASLTVTPVFSAETTVQVTASLSVAPALLAEAQAAHVASATLTVTPALLAEAERGRHRTAALTVTPTFSASRAGSFIRAASLTVHAALAAAAANVVGAPPGYPDGVLDPRIEFWLGAGWQDVTKWATNDGQVSATLTSGQRAGAQQPSPATMSVTFDNEDGRFSPRNENGPWFGQIGQNTPVRFSVASPYGTYLRLEGEASSRLPDGVTGSYVSCPEASRLDITGSMEIRVEMDLSDHYLGADIAGKYDGTARSSWVINGNDDNTLSFWWMESGGTVRHAVSTEPYPLTAKALRVTLDVSNGDVTYYTGPDIDGPWTRFGDVASGTSGAATSVHSGSGGAAELTIGWSPNNPTWQTLGRIHRFQLLNGIGGTVVADANFSRVAPGATSWTDDPGNTWTVNGLAEVTARDYRLYGELSSLAPTAPRGAARMQASIAGRLRRMQQPGASAIESPMHRTVLSLPGDLLPIAYWPMEGGSDGFGPAIGSSLMSVQSGAVKPAADTTFAASAALPAAGTALLQGNVDAYTGGTAWTVRFLLKRGGTLPGEDNGNAANLARVFIASPGAARQVDLDIDNSGFLRLTGKNASGGQVFRTEFINFNGADGDPAAGVWMALDAVPATGGKTFYNVVAVEPGAGTGTEFGQSLSPPVTGVTGNVTSVQFNSDKILADTVIGHVTVQKSWDSMFNYGFQLNAYSGEVCVSRFARVCQENGIPFRFMGASDTTPLMGPQPRGSLWKVLQDTVNADQGILYEVPDILGMGFRARSGMGNQNAAARLSFADGNLPGDLQPVDNDSGLTNDVTASMPDGTTFRVQLDDGSRRSVSEPPVGMGRYAGQPPQPFNLASAGQLQEAASFYLAAHSVDEAQFGNVSADYGIPGAPAADLARVRPGDLVVITGVPDVYQSADIRQVVTGSTEAFGPGRTVTWDCVPASPYDSATSGGGGGGGGGDDGGGGDEVTYEQALYDDFSGGSIDGDKWSTDEDGPDGITQSGGTLKIAAESDEHEIGTQDTFDLTTGIWAVRYSHTGTPAAATHPGNDEGTQVYWGFDDAADNYFELQTTPGSDFWIAWADDEGASVSDADGDQDAFSSAWDGGDFIGFGDYNLGNDNRLHVYKSGDGGSTWTEVASWEVTGDVDMTAVHAFMGTNQFTGSSNWVSVFDDASFFTRQVSSGGGGAAGTLTAVGDPGYADATTFSLTPQDTGNVIVAFVANFSGADVTGLSNSSVTWEQWVTSQDVGDYVMAAFKGTVTSTSEASVTVSTANAADGIRIAWQEFEASTGADSVDLETFGTWSVDGTTWPPLSALAGWAYAGFEVNGGDGAVAGSTPGYTYDTGDPHGNGFAYSIRSSDGQTSPAWGDTAQRDALAVLFKAGGSGSGGGTGATVPSAPLLGMYMTDGAFPAPGPSAWASGARTNVTATYIAWEADWDDYGPPFIQQCIDNGLVPIIELEPWNFDKSAIPFGDITGGTYDDKLEEIGTSIASFGVPVILIWAHEMNVSGQYPWSQDANATLTDSPAASGHRGSGPDGADLTADEWIEGWAYVKDKVNSTAGGWALWMWACSAWTGGTTIDPSPWWPPDSLPDMAALDGYPDTEFGDELGTFTGQLGQTVDAIRALGWTDDIFIAETNLREMVDSGGQDITSFVADMHDAGISGILEFEDASWGLSEMTSSEWTEYNDAVTANYGAGGGDDGGGATYTQTLIDGFTGSSLDTSKWLQAVGGEGVSVSSGTLKVQGITGSEQTLVYKTFNRNLADGIFALQLSQSGTGVDGTMWFLGISDGFISDGANGYEFQAFPARGEWYSWSFDAGQGTEDSGDQDILSPGTWHNGDWLGIGNHGLDGSDDVHVYKSGDGETWTEIASFHVTGAVDESSCGFYFGTNYDDGASGTSTYLATIDNVSFFTRG